jgi:outer membrane protein assembly factor BamB
VVAALAALFDDLVPLETLAPSGAVALARELAFGLADLGSGARERVVVPTEAPGPGAAWEVGLERDGDCVLVTLFRQGDRPRVAQTARPLSMDVARESVLAALERAGAGDRGLGLAREALVAATDEAPSRRASFRKVELRSTRKSTLDLRASFELRETAPAPSSEVARADLFPLLFRGDVALVVGKSRRGLTDAHVFLLAEQLVSLATAALRAQPGRPATLRRLLPGGVCCGAQLDGRGEAIVHVSDGVGGELGARAGGWRLPPVSCREFALAARSFGARLAGAVVAVDPAQRHNLRLSAFRRAVRDLAAELGAGQPASIRNDAPQSYRAFVESAPLPPVTTRTAPPGKLRFEEAWRADVPGLDLRAGFVAGDRVVVGSPRELACIERASGHIVWTRRTHRAASVMTPAGVARLGADGSIGVHDLATGDVAFRLQLGPCSGASTSGAVIATPGLPRMLLVCEGARHLAAIDLASGEVRWRRAVRGRDAGRHPIRLRPAGKLVCVASGETVLTALDLLTGEVVWRSTGASRYVHVVLDGGDLFALGVGPDAATVERIEPWTGAVAWRTTLGRGLRPAVPIGPAETVVVPARSGRGEATLCALDRATGAPRWDKSPSRARAACIGLDGLVVCNAEDGTLAGVEAATGEVRWRRLLTEGRAQDRPATLAPVLRSGALFVPQTDLYVVRPSDGTLLGRLPTDLVPDALRVDEMCGVYVAEASGYVAAYRALPALRLV